jgi:hypothetical protein
VSVHEKPGRLVRRQCDGGDAGRIGRESEFPVRGPARAAARGGADLPNVGPGRSGAWRAGASRRAAAGIAGLLLLSAVTAGLLGQGGYYGSVQRLVGLLLGIGTAVALAAWPPTRGDVRVLVIPGLALAGWAVLDAALLGVPVAGGIRLASLLLGVLAVLLICRRLSVEDRELLLAGVLVAGVLVAMAGWLGVAVRITAWAWEGDGIWRASSTLTYPNAAAAVLVPLAVLVVARLVEVPKSMLLVVVAVVLLTGVGATLSRAAALGLAVGLVVLVWLRGPARIARAAAGPGVGALVAVAGLLPSMPAAQPPRPMLAVVGLGAGIAVAAVLARPPRWRSVRVLVAALLLAAPAALILAGGAAGGPVDAVAQARITLASPDRTGALRAAVQVAAAHPVTGTGAGLAELRGKGPDGVTRYFRYAHNEYVQIAAELGLVGLSFLAILLVALGRLLWSAGATCRLPGAWAGVVAGAAAFAVHSGFDFVWHLPAVVLTVVLLIGAVLPSRPGVEQSANNRQLEKGV